MLALHQLADELNRERLARAELRRAARNKRSWRIPLKSGVRRRRPIPVGAVPQSEHAADLVGAGRH
jgi:hypothetical protein